MESKAAAISTDQLGVCLVTGAAGFLGRNLVSHLLDEGLTVRVLVRSTALEMQHENLRCIPGDVCEVDDMLRACDGADTVFHTAALISLLGGAAAHKAYRNQAL